MKKLLGKLCLSSSASLGKGQMSPGELDLFVPPCSSPTTLLSSAIFYSELFPKTCRNVALSRHAIVKLVVTPQGPLA